MLADFGSGSVGGLQRPLRHLMAVSVTYQNFHQAFFFMVVVTSSDQLE